MQQDEAAQALPDKSYHSPQHLLLPLFVFFYDTACTQIYHSRNKDLTSILHRHSSNFVTTSENSGLPCAYNRKSRAVLKIEETSSVIEETNRYMRNHKSPPFPFLWFSLHCFQSACESDGNCRFSTKL